MKLKLLPKIISAPSTTIQMHTNLSSVKFNLKSTSQSLDPYDCKVEPINIYCSQVIRLVASEICSITWKTSGFAGLKYVSKVVLPR